MKISAISNFKMTLFRYFSIFSNEIQYPKNIPVPLFQTIIRETSMKHFSTRLYKACIE